MQKRYAVIWFRFLKTDYWIRKNPSYSGKPLVMYTIDHGRMIISAAVASVWVQGIGKGTVVADAKAIIPGLLAVQDEPLKYESVLQKIAAWFIRYSPNVSINNEDDIVLDATGCTHLWGGEERYLRDIHTRLEKIGYKVHIAIADTIGVAWACAHFYDEITVVPSGQQQQYLSILPPSALRIDPLTNEKLVKLGLKQIGFYITYHLLLFAGDLAFVLLKDCNKRWVILMSLLFLLYQAQYLWNDWNALTRCLPGPV